MNYKAQQIVLPDSELILYPELFSALESDHLLTALSNDIAWRQEQVTLFGKRHKVPRLSAWYGDQGKTYTYSGLKSEPQPWIEALTEIKNKIERVSRVIFNSVLVNLYRNGADGVGWHSDDEPELGLNPVIGSVSFGQERVFQFKHKHDKSLKHTMLLPHGSLLLMRGPTQAHWRHQLPKSKKTMQPRINLTYRIIR